MILLVLLTACDSSPHSESAARSAIENHLADRYGEAFAATRVTHIARGLDGLEADRHAFQAHPVAQEGQSFQGTVDFDLEPRVWVEDFPCIRGEQPIQAALDDVVKRTGAHIVKAESRCLPDALPDADPHKLGAAFQWKVRLAIFDTGELSEVTTPLHKLVDEAAAEVGLGSLSSQVDVYERGVDTVRHFPDVPIPPSVSMWYRGTTVQTEPGGAVTTARTMARATAIEAQLTQLVGSTPLPHSTTAVRVFGTDEIEARIRRTPEIPLDQLPIDEHLSLEGYLSLAIIGLPADRGDEVRAWVESLYRRLPPGRFAPSTYVVFFDPSVDDRPLDTQPDKQREVWLYSRSAGIRIRSDGIAQVIPITAIRYAIPAGSP